MPSLQISWAKNKLAYKYSQMIALFMVSKRQEKSGNLGFFVTDLKSLHLYNYEYILITFCSRAWEFSLYLIIRKMYNCRLNNILSEIFIECYANLPVRVLDIKLLVISWPYLNCKMWANVC